MLSSILLVRLPLFLRVQGTRLLREPLFFGVIVKRTVIYIDGFNLYYGALKGTPYKWLDLKTLFTRILSNTHKITAIKYYTAKIKAHNDDRQAMSRQQVYLRALKTYIPEISICLGHYLTHTIKLPLANSVGKGIQFVNVVKSEEKGSDVNLAVHMLNDAWLDVYDCAVVVSNDSDLAESMCLVKTHHQKLIGLVAPVRAKQRMISKELKRHADFIKMIRDGNLAASQLPAHIPGTTLYKPSTW